MTSTNGTIVPLTPNALKVDPDTQRALNTVHAKKIAMAFDPTLVGLLEVSKRHDGYYVIDGQHRRAAAIMAGHGDKPIACHVVTGLDTVQEAHRFVGINSTVKKPQAIDLFRLRVKAEDPVAVDVHRIITGRGLTVSFNSTPGNLSAIAAAEAVYHGWGTPRPGAPWPQLLDMTLEALNNAWGLERDAYDATILKAMGSLLGTYMGRLDLARLATRLGKASTPAQLIGRAKALGDATRQSRPVATRSIIIDTYNHSMKSGRLDKF